MTMTTPSPAPAADPRPVAPEPLQEGDCCHSGCTHCVQDWYDDALQRYREQLQAWLKRHPGQA
ncbi:MAG: oxidoreductase-like domain-containing protein [Pseudomonadota bacterium]